jgi:hypothetical protein
MVAGNNIVIANADGSGKRVLGSGRGSFLSPDGSHVAVTDFDVVGTDATNRRLELFASAGGTPARVPNIACGSIAWSPDSQKVACVDRDASRTDVGRLVLIDVASAATSTLVQGLIDYEVSFSPDSTQIAFVQRTTANAVGGNLKRIDLASKAIATVRSGKFAAPVWGPTAIAFGTVRARPRNVGPVYDVVLVQPGGGGFRRLTHVRVNFLQVGLLPVAWSADGKRLLAGLAGQDTWLGYAIDPVRGGARRISQRVAPSALSRDGSYIVGDTTGGEDYGPRRANVVRVPWARGGKAHVLLRDAYIASFNG